MARPTCFRTLFRAVHGPAGDWKEPDYGTHKWKSP